MRKSPLKIKTQKDLLCEFLRLFYEKGWVSGTGGGICGIAGSQGVLMAPTGVHKERLNSSDFFLVDPKTEKIHAFPKNPSLSLSECSPIFCTLIRDRDAGSVMHSHALSAVLAADLAGRSDHVVFKDLEMLKGIRGVSNKDKHSVPVIENTGREPDLTQQINTLLKRKEFGNAFAILVRDHGAYIWGEDLWEAKRHAEVYHFIFEATAERYQRKPKGDG